MPECRFTSTALGALRLAQENAARLGHSYVGSEHLLLGLASQEYSAAARSLQSSGVDSRSLRSAISQLVGTGVPARSLHQGLTPKCCLAIQQAAAAAWGRTLSARSTCCWVCSRTVSAPPAALWRSRGRIWTSSPRDWQPFWGARNSPPAPSDPGNRSAAPIPACWTSAPGT